MRTAWKVCSAFGWCAIAITLLLAAGGYAKANAADLVAGAIGALCAAAFCWDNL